MEEFDSVDTVLELHRTKKIDWMLRQRIVILIILAALFGYATVVDIVSFHANPWPVTWFFPGGALAGFLWFYRMTPVRWDEKTGTMKIRAFDIAGFFFLGLYFLSRAILAQILSTEISSVIGVAIATYSSICGIMVGRLLGLFGVIHKIHTEQSKK